MHKRNSVCHHHIIIIERFHLCANLCVLQSSSRKQLLHHCHFCSKQEQITNNYVSTDASRFVECFPLHFCLDHFSPAKHLRFKVQTRSGTNLLLPCFQDLGIMAAHRHLGKGVNSLPRHGMVLCRLCRRVGVSRVFHQRMNSVRTDCFI